MNSFKPFLMAIGLVILHSVAGRCQVIVNGKNLNDDKDLDYIQLMYAIDKSSLKPVFFVDYGFIEADYNEILKPGKHFKPQRIEIEGEEVSDGVTVVWMLNQMHKAGWEYMGDVVYVPIPMMDNWNIFTLKRR